MHAAGLGIKPRRRFVRTTDSAVHIIASDRLRTDEKTKTYVARRIAEGHSKLEASRSLKRYIARDAFGIVMRRQQDINRTRIAARQTEGRQRLPVRIPEPPGCP